MTEYERLAIVIAVISGIISILSVIFAFFRWRASYQSAQMSSATMYKSINELIEKQRSLRPLTPYGSEADEEAVELRVFLLMRLNRFKFSTGRKDKKEHILFRKRTMGMSLKEFRRLLIERGASDKYADKAVHVFSTIKNNEPYLNDKFWKTFFADFDWTIPNTADSQALRSDA